VTDSTHGRILRATLGCLACPCTGRPSAEIRWRRSAVESFYAGHPAGPYHEVAHEFLFAPELRALRDKTRQFVAEQVIPLENDERQSHHGPSEALRDELVARARDAGLLTPHASRDLGGMGLSHVEKAVVFEEAGYSWLGPTALNIHAPDEGNIHLMEAVATPCKRRWLRPQVAGATRSCFAMTEPAPGAGADPSMLATTARRDGDDYVINGRKWFITGAEGAHYAIIMARMEDGSATMFLSDMDRPGITLERNMDAMDSCFAGGHGVLRLTICVCRQRMCWARSARAFATPRCAWPRRA
jgi:acyl-CoA dehydrogenase